MGPDDPPPKVYGFRDREFIRDNAPAGAHPPLPTAKELAMMAGSEAPQASRAKAGPKAGDPNDVYNVLQQNRAVERKFGKDKVAIREIKSRRKRDYWLLLVPSELLLGMITWRSWGNPVVFVSALAGMVLVGVALTWIMWQVMDNY